MKKASNAHSATLRSTRCRTYASGMRNVAEMVIVVKQKENCSARAAGAAKDRLGYPKALPNPASECLPLLASP